MRLLFIRHGDPDYENDTVTEKGKREVELLAKRAESLELGNCFVSPLGRARDTASPSLKRTGKTAETLDWLEEFPAKIDLNKVPHFIKAYPDTKTKDGRYLPRIIWDVVPSYWTEHSEYSDAEKWRTSEISRNSDLVEIYDRVTEAFDRLLEEHGYVREGAHYRVERESEETLTFFCHFGVSCVLLSHLWSVSPFVLWHSLALAPSSVTEVVTEEREKGIAYFRGLKIGDISHLYAGHEPVSFAARFAEIYGNKDQRH
ncbi:MAG TPA: histidine phosphatase family protein [Candidatus Mediterraneibacter norfolkensis]|nr:histidine phosphatase family protein [Candidatus Mediterraneibacter norfolkensis]